MDTRFATYNSHLYGLKDYWNIDHNLLALKAQPLVYRHPILDTLPREIYGIYTIGGGRQIGKTTLLKQWIYQLLKSGVEPNSIVFYSGELIDDHHALVELLQQYTQARRQKKILYIIIDEITYIKQWDKGIKFAADAGYLQKSVVILTGSDLSLMQAAKMTFPGRRGNADIVDFHIYSLSFKEYLKLKKILPDISTLKNREILSENSEIISLLYDEFQNYLKHGGYLTAINDIAKYNYIKPATLRIYSDWIRGDMLKRNKQETLLKEVLQAIIKRYNSQITWHALASDLSIDSHKTVAEYCNLLATMDALFIQPALLQDKLTSAPKKARKLTFADPFIYHAIKQWISPIEKPYARIEKNVLDNNISSALVEAIVSNQFRRYYPTYYIKADKEIDLAYVDQNKFWPIEIKWRNQVRESDLKQIKKYPNGKIYCKIYQPSNIENVPLYPLPLALILDDCM